MAFQSDPAERSQRQEGKRYEASFKVRFARIVWGLSNVYVWMNFAHMCQRIFKGLLGLSIYFGLGCVCDQIIIELL